MSLRPLNVRATAFNDLWEDMEYSPPKDALDGQNLQGFFSSGAYSLPEEQKEETVWSYQSEFCDTPIMEGKDTDSRLETVGLEERQLSDCLSDTVSFKKGASTATTASLSTAATHLVKRRPDKACHMTVEHSRSAESDLFLGLVFGDDFAVDLVADIIIKFLDKKEPISDEEWRQLSLVDRQALAYYLMPLYGRSPNCCLDTPRSLNSLIEFKFKAKRNEEKLNKVVKQVNCMLARTFADLNGLPCDENLALKMNEAYFDQQAEVFGQKVTYTQQSFSKLVACRKYRADFEAIMTCALVREFCDRRHAKVTQEVKRLRRKFLEGNYSAAQTELNKRSPWTLSDMVEGIHLCQSIIKKQLKY